MKLLTLTQPWATLVAIGEKRIETRAWKTSYRGPLAIHAAKGLKGLGAEATERDLDWLCAMPSFAEALESRGLFSRVLPRGAIVAICDLVEMVPVPEGALRIAQHGAPFECNFGNYGPGRWAWFLDNVRPLDAPVPCRGERGLPNVPRDVRELLEIRLAAQELGVKLN